MRVMMTLCILMIGWAERGSPAADLTKVKRTIAVLPAFETKTPGYCLLVFGNDAQTRVWLVVDGRRVFLDLNGNGDLTESGEEFTIEGRNSYRYLKVNSLLSADGKKTYDRLYLRLLPKREFRVSVRLPDNYSQLVGQSRGLRPKLGDSPGKAPIIHFDGPMTFGQFGEKQEISRHNDPKKVRQTWMRLMIGTPGLGRGTFAPYHCNCRRSGGDLMARFEYVGPDGKPVNVTTALKTKG